MGKTGKLIRKVSLFVLILVFLLSSFQTTMCFLVTKTDSLVNTFAPFESKAGSLILNKIVEHPLGEGYSIPDNISFNYEVNLGEKYANTTIETTAGSCETDNNGVAIVPVKPNKSVVITGIDVGTKVSISESSETSKGFKPKYAGSVETVVISGEDSVEAGFTNIYSPEKVSGEIINISGIKILSGREWIDGDEFTTIIEQETNNNWVSLGKGTVKYSEDTENYNGFDFNSIFKEISFDKPGNYKFRIVEEKGDIPHIEYDDTINTFTVEIGDSDMDGNLEVTSITGDNNITVSRDEDSGKYNINVVFNNTYNKPGVEEPDNIIVPLNITKVIRNNNGTPLSNFEFKLVNTVDGSKKLVKSDKSGKAVIELEFTSDDIGKKYFYELTEVKGSIENMKYDTSKYSIEIFITKDNNNNLVANIVCDDKNVEKAYFKFTNKYGNSFIHNLIDDDDDKDGGIRTGDDFNYIFWIIMLLSSAIVFIVVLRMGILKKD